MTAVPDLYTVSYRMGREAADIADAYSAEVADQASRCRVNPYNAALAEALHRRVARSMAMRNVPLGVVMDENGGTRIGAVDPEVRRLEGPYRRLAIA